MLSRLNIFNSVLNLLGLNFLQQVSDYYYYHYLLHLDTNLPDVSEYCVINQHWKFYPSYEWMLYDVRIEVIYILKVKIPCN